MEVESLKQHYLSNDYANFGLLIAYIYNTFKPLNQEYPNYNHWFFNKQIAEISIGQRDVLFIRSHNDMSDIFAISCLKKTDKEQKICGIYVKERYRNLGYGKKLLKESFKWLKTDKPIISISEDKLSQFAPFINKYNWTLTETRDCYYSNKKEYCYNKAKVKINIKQKES